MVQSAIAVADPAPAVPAGPPAVTESRAALPTLFGAGPGARPRRARVDVGLALGVARPQRLDPVWSACAPAELGGAPLDERAGVAEAGDGRHAVQGRPARAAS